MLILTLFCRCGASFNTTAEGGNVLCPSCRKLNNKKIKNVANFDENFIRFDDSFKLSDFDVLKQKHRGLK